MIRLLGILLGAVIAVAVLIVVIGIPQITPDDTTDNITVQLPLEPEPVAAPEAAADASDEEPVAADLPDLVELDAIEEVIVQPIQEPVATEEPVEPPATSASVPAPFVELRWYAFWSPFRSQIAANGFVSQLQRVTGLDYRVVSVKPGVYEVAFAYSSDDEIQDNLSQISAATGLEMPET